MRNSAVATLFYLAAASVCAAGTPPAADTNAAKGIPFSLPKTLLTVDLTVTKMTKTRGEFCQYVDLFFGVSREDAKKTCTDIPKSGKSTTVVKDYTVTTVGVPDMSRTYLLPPVQKGGWAIDTSSSVELTERGLLNSIADERLNRRTEVVLSILKGVLGFAARRIGSAQLTAEDQEAPDDDIVRFRKEFLVKWHVIWHFDQLDENRKRVLFEQWKAKHPPLFAARAAFDALSDLDEKYERVLGGEGAVGAATLIAEIRQEMERRVNTFFLGTTETVTWTPSLELEPRAGETTLVLIDACGARVNDGVRLLRNPAPSSIYCPDAMTGIGLTLEAEASSSINVGSIDACLTGNVLRGIPFIVPGEVSVRLTQLSRLPPQRVQVAQLGRYSCLEFPGSSYTATVAYYPSGAIKSVKFTNKSRLTKEAVDAMATATGDLQKAIADARAKAEREATTKDLEELKARRERLEEQVKIKTACATLGTTCEF